MDALQAILTRRSVRRFCSRVVPHDVVENVLQAAMSAPSAVNEQPWHFLIVDDKKLLQRIVEVHPHSSMCAESPVAVIPCVDFNYVQHKHFWVQDMSAATENMLLAIRAFGLGAVWVGVYPNEERIAGIRQIFALGDSIIPFAIIPFGYTDAKQQECKERFQSNRIHRNKW